MIDLPADCCRTNDPAIMLCDCDRAEVENKSTAPADSNAYALRLKVCAEFIVNAGDAERFVAFKIEA